MSGQAEEELKQRILTYLGRINRARNRDVARAMGVDKELSDKVIGELAREGKIEYQNFGGVTYIVLTGK